LRLYSYTAKTPVREWPAHITKLLDTIYMHIRQSLFNGSSVSNY